MATCPMRGNNQETSGAGKKKTQQPNCCSSALVRDGDRRCVVSGEQKVSKLRCTGDPSEKSDALVVVAKDGGDAGGLEERFTPAPPSLRAQCGAGITVEVTGAPVPLQSGCAMSPLTTESAKVEGGCVSETRIEFGAPGDDGGVASLLLDPLRGLSRLACVPCFADLRRRRAVVWIGVAGVDSPGPVLVLRSSVLDDRGSATRASCDVALCDPSCTGSSFRSGESPPRDSTSQR